MIHDKIGSLTSSRTSSRRWRTATYDALPEEFRKRYRPSGYLLFGDTKKDAEGRRLLREQVARDMHDSGAVEPILDQLEKNGLGSAD